MTTERTGDSGDARIRVLLVEAGRDREGVLQSCLGAVPGPVLSISRADTLAGALAALASSPFDVVLLRPDLPDGNGADVVRQIAGQASAAPIIVLASKCDAQSELLFAADGVFDCLVTDTLTSGELARSLRRAAERSRLESRLREAESRSHALFEHTGTALLSLDRDTVIRHMNERAGRLLGSMRGEIEGRLSLAELLPPETPLLKTLEALRKDPTTPGQFESSIVRRSGGVRRVLVHVAGLPGSEELIVSLHDLSAHDQAEIEVRRQREYFRALFENSPEGIVAFDAEGLVVDVNPAFERLFGFKLGELVGRNIVEIIAPPRLQASAREILRKSLSGGSYVTQTVRRRSDGSEVAVSILGAAVTLDGEHAGGFGIYRDVSAQLAAQERLEEAFIDLVETTVRMMESVDPYTAKHQRMVARLADIVGRKLELEDDQLQGLYVGGLLHDIGKMSLPSTILTKPGRLTSQEWDLIRSHPQRGYDVLLDAKLPWPVADMALRHHERLDGSGYPGGIAGEQLSMDVRILGVCDVVEAMSSDRPYRAGLPVEAVLQELREGAGIRYEPRVVQAAVDAIEQGVLVPGRDD